MEEPSARREASGCARCTEPYRPASAVAVAVIVLLVVVLVCCLVRGLGRRQKDGFASSAREVYDDSRALFDRTGGGASYSEYKLAVRHADPVLYADTRRLWKAGQLSPANVRAVL
jgi:hypothetical protein